MNPVLFNHNHNNNNNLLLAKDLDAYFFTFPRKPTTGVCLTSAISK